MARKDASEEKLREEIRRLRTRVAEQERPAESSPIEAMAVVAGGVANDVNSLMEGILGNAALLREELGEGHPALARIAGIEEAAEEAGGLTRKLLLFAQGREPRSQRINVNPIAARVLLVEEQRLAPRIRISRYLNPDLWDIVADHAQITRLIINLTINAVESIAGKEGRVTLRTRNIEIDDGSIPKGSGLRPGPYVFISVEDNGVGIPPEALERLFDPDFSTKSPKRGLGLAVAYQVVSNLGGHIAVNSRPDWGSVFRVYLPAVKEPERRDAAHADRLPGGNETILVVDDEQMVLNVSCEALRRLGYTTLVAHDGREALEVVSATPGPIHLVLLDMVMPVMGGAEAFPLLKQARPDMRVIVCTGFMEGPATRDILHAGADAILFKPYRPAVLLQEIRRVLDGQPARG